MVKCLFHVSKLIQGPQVSANANLSLSFQDQLILTLRSPIIWQIIRTCWIQDISQSPHF